MSQSDPPGEGRDVRILIEAVWLHAAIQMMV